MLKQVSWAEYLTVLALLVTLYYFIILLIFYRDDFRQLLLMGKGGRMEERGETVPERNQ
jgi:hypothetical protein